MRRRGIGRLVRTTLLWSSLAGVAVTMLAGCGMAVKESESDASEQGTTPEQLSAYFEAIRPGVLAYYAAAKDLDAANADYNAGRLESCVTGFRVVADDYRRAADLIGKVDPPAEIDSVSALTAALRDKASSARKITRILGPFVAGKTTIGETQKALNDYIPIYEEREARASEALAHWDQDLHSLAKKLRWSAPEWWTKAAEQAQ